jgi:hypothetical protein
MEMLDENYNLFLTGMMTGSEFNKFVRIHFIETNSSYVSKRNSPINSSK